MAFRKEMPQAQPKPPRSRPASMSDIGKLLVELYKEVKDEELIDRIFKIYQEIQANNKEYQAQNKEKIIELFGLKGADKINRDHCVYLLFLLQNRPEAKTEAKSEGIFLPLTMHNTSAYANGAIKMLAIQLKMQNGIPTMMLSKKSNGDEEATYSFSNHPLNNKPASPQEITGELGAEKTLAYAIDEQGVLRLRESNHVHVASFAERVKLSGNAIFVKEKEGWRLKEINDETGGYHLNLSTKAFEDPTVQTFDYERFRKYKAHAEKTLAEVGLPPAKLKLMAEELAAEFVKAQKGPSSKTGEDIKANSLSPRD